MQAPRIFGEIAIEAAPSERTESVEADGEVILVAGDGQIFWCQLPADPVEIGNVGRRISTAHAVWSPDRRKVLLYLDIGSSNDWFVWDHDQLVHVTGPRSRALGIQGTGKLAWAGNDRLITGVVAEETRAVAVHSTPRGGTVRLIGLDPLRIIRTIRPTSDDENPVAWLAPDRSYLVMSVGDWKHSLRRDRGVERHVEIWDMEGQLRAAFDQQMMGEWCLRWPDGSPDEFLIRTDAAQAMRYDWHGQEVGRCEWPGGPDTTWEHLAWRPQEQLSQDKAGRWLLQKTGGTVPIEPEGATAHHPVCPADNRFVAYTDGEGGRLLIYRSATDDVVSVEESCACLQWSPDGSRLAAALQRADQPALAVIEPAGPSGMIVSADHDTTAQRLDAVQWCGGGSCLYYNWVIGGPAWTRECWLVGADGHTEKRLIRVDDVVTACWGPDDSG